MEVRVRYAPSPTGYLHIGGARTAIFNYLFAKHHQGKFIVRIEDTDLERNIADSISSQLENLRWLGINIDETIDNEGEYGPHQQMPRWDLYLSYAQKLLAKQQAYYCFCNKTTIAAMRKKQHEENKPAFKYDKSCLKLSYSQINHNLTSKKSYVIRVKIPPNRKLIVADMVRKQVLFDTNDFGDFVIIKSNGVPTYNFAVVIDDHLMKISHVLRGEEHLSNTPKQLVIYDHFGWIAPKFGHLTLIINHEGKKLSKRDGQVMQFIHQYRKQGFLPEALFNFITLLGWNPHEEREIYNQLELIEVFNSAYLSKAPSIFDVQKLRWMNNFYIKKMTKAEYLALVTPFVKTNYNWSAHDNEWWEELLLIYQKQLLYGAEIVALIALFFKKKLIIDEESKAIISTETSKIVINTFAKRLKSITTWEVENIKSLLQEVKKSTKITGKQLFMPLRIVCSGTMTGPELPQTIKLLGKRLVLQRIASFQNHE